MALLMLVVLVSCGTAGKISAISKDDKDLFKAITAINKSNNAEARKDLPALHDLAVQRHEGNISSYRNSDNPDRWPKIIHELEALQQIHTTINSIPALSGLVSTRDYSAQLREAKENGAAEYYELGMQLMESGSRQDARKAYEAFQNVNKMYPNYRNTASLMREARERGVLDVVINPIRSQGYFYTSTFRSDNFQRELVRDLGGSFGNSFSGARFYTDWEARSSNVEPDWVVDLAWENVYMGIPRDRNYTRTVSREIEVGKDTSGRVIYKTVNATLHITSRVINARADMVYRITDLEDGDDVEWSRIPGYLDLSYEHATYTGDSRALSNYDWALVNNRRQMYRSDDDILDALYARVYPDLRSRLESATRW